MNGTTRARPAAGLIAVVVLTMAALFAADQFLARMERTELDREAAQEYLAGMAAFRAGRASAALPHLARAHSVVRSNTEYQLALAKGQAAAGQLDRAEANIRDLLARNSNDGGANLEMARLSARLKRPDDAYAFYHRAIFGEWRGNADERRLQSRLELADYLAAQNRPAELLSELLVLESRVWSDPALARHVAGLFVAAGSPARGAAAYREILSKNPADLETYRGLAEAEVRAGDFRAAQAAYLNALRRQPDDPALAKGLQVANTLAQMDPTPRRLASAEKYKRSAALLASVRDKVAACAGPGPLPAELNSWMEDSAARLSSKPRGRATNEEAEALLTAAEHLWNARPAGCAATLNDPVSLLMNKVKAQ